ncbi:MAG: hypothetical protein ACFFCS_03630 [Candidatus Hodarchaeota archaeon]
MVEIRKTLNASKGLLILVIGLISTYSIVFISNWDLIGGTSAYTWPNLQRPDFDLDNPETAFDARVKDGFEQYLNSYIGMYDADLGMVITGSGDDDIARTRIQVRIALVCLALSSKNATYKQVANSLLRTTFQQFQEHTPASGYRTFGNFYWDLADEKVEDLNAGPFNSLVLGYIFHYYTGLLDADVVSMWEDGAAEVLATCVHRAKDPNYTNIHLLRTSGVLMLGKYFGDTSAIRLGMQMFREWKNYIYNIGLTEYTTINYYKVSLRAMMAIWEFSPDETFSNEVQPMVDYLWLSYIIQENNGNMGGSHSRDYDDDYFYGDGIRTFIEHYIGDYYPENDTESDWLTLFNWQPTETMKQLAANKTYPYNVQYCYGGIRAFTYFTENYSLGSQHGVNPNGEVGSQSIPIYATINTTDGGIDTGNRRNTIFFKDNHGGRNFRTATVQENNTLVAGMRFDPEELDTDEQVGVLGFLGNASAINELWLNGTNMPKGNWNTKWVVNSNTTICYSIGDIFVGIRLWILPGSSISSDLIEIMVYNSSLDPNGDWSDAREDELMVNLKGDQTCSGMILQLDDESKWSSFADFLNDFLDNTSYHDEIDSGVREINCTINNTSYLVKEIVQENVVTLQEINNTALVDEHWIYQSPWLSIQHQDIDYTTPLFTNEQFKMYILLSIVSMVSAALLVALLRKRLVLPQPGEEGERVVPANTAFITKAISHLVLVGLSLLNIILISTEGYSFTLVLLASIIQNFAAILLLWGQFQKKKKNGAVQHLNLIGTTLLSSVLLNLTIFCFGLMVTRFYSWLSIIMYCVSQAFFGISLITCTIKDINKEKRASKKPRWWDTLMVVVAVVLGLLYIGFGILLLVDTEELEVVALILWWIQLSTSSLKLFGDFFNKKLEKGKKARFPLQSR